LNEENVCLGCFRSLHEITQWSEAGDDMRKIILKNCERRRQDYGKKWLRSKY